MPRPAAQPRRSRPPAPRASHPRAHVLHDGPVGSGTGAVVCRTPLGCVRRFRLRARLGGSITPSPTPATSNRTGGFPASRLTAKVSSIGVMGPFSRGMLSRSSTPRGSLERDPTFGTPRRYSPPLAESLALVCRGGLRPLAYLRSKFLQTDGGLCHPALASLLCSDCLR